MAKPLYPAPPQPPPGADGGIGGILSGGGLEAIMARIRAAHSAGMPGADPEVQGLDDGGAPESVAGAAPPAEPPAGLEKPLLGVNSNPYATFGQAPSGQPLPVNAGGSGQAGRIGRLMRRAMPAVASAASRGLAPAPA